MSHESEDDFSDMNIEWANVVEGIDDVEEDGKEWELDEARKDEIRPSKNSVVSAKLPEFWQELIEQIDVQTAELGKKFLGDDRYQLSRHPFPGGFSLKQGKYALTTLTVTPKFEGQCIHVLQGGSAGVYGSYSSGVARTQISVDVDHDNGLVLRYEGRNYATAEQLAKALLHHALPRE